MRGHRRAERAVGADAVLDDDRRLQQFCQPLRHNARHAVSPAAGRERRDHRYPL
jgi:hypothetical protein